MHHRQMPASRMARDEQSLRTNPPMSYEQMQLFNSGMGGIARPSGGFTGCGYVDFDQGIVCQNGNINRYQPNAPSFFSNWTSNTDYPYGPDFPQPNVMADGTIAQIMAGGGGGYNACIQDCACTAANPQCMCGNVDPSLMCGYASMGSDCMEPVPNGQYPSLAACEFANSLGYYKK